MSLPTDAKDRKGLPIASGVLNYFPDAIAAIAELSRIGNDQHNPGQPLHWNRSKSTDHDDCLIRHFMERGAFDTDGVRHSTKVAWRALALLQTELEKASCNAPDLRNVQWQDGWILTPDGRLIRSGKYQPVHIPQMYMPHGQSHPMAAEALRDEYSRDDNSTGV